jgi:ABC-2 type transport system ATP-binding protein
LIATPPIIFLDEPTTGLDPRSRLQMWDVIEKLKKDGATILLTTQYLEEADKLADKIAVIDHGKIIAMGTSAELKQQTNTNSLEEAFLQLTGKTIRDEASSGKDQFRQMARVWGGKK